MAAQLQPPALAGAIPQLGFAIEDAQEARDSLTPAIHLALRVSCGEQREVHSILLEAQVRIAPRRRPYGEGEEERLADLFGPVSQWASSMQGLLWANATVVVPRFAGSMLVEVPIPCTYDFEVSAARYLAALEEGEIPLDVLFSGTVFLAADDGRLQVVRIPLEHEAAFDLPVAVWRAAIDRHFPGGAWLRLDRRSFERLHEYRSRRVLPSWDAVVDSLLEEEGR